MADDSARPRPYHHGNLEEALLTIGLALAEEGGPEAVTVREAARRAGVSANAAYRHFRDLEELRARVAHEARGRLAASMLDALAHRPRRRTEAARAREQLAAVGRGYIRFALEHPNLFRCASAAPEPPDARLEAWALLEEALQACARAGLIPRARLEAAGVAAWSLVHGFADLALRGRLGANDSAMLQRRAEEILTIFLRGWQGEERRPARRRR
jgi:AcrR family transcriptional regulator